MTPRLLSGARRIAWALAGQLLIALPAQAAPTPAEKAAAEALFQEGTELMGQKSFSAACSKFEASNAIESGLGVKLWLADCYDHAGRSASAWALFSEAASLAHQSGQTEREHAAGERAQELEARLSKLTLKPPARGLPRDLKVTLNGTDIPAASVGTALPVDPGVQHVVLRAAGFRPLTLQSDVPVGPTTVALDVPELTPEPAPRQQMAPAGPTAPAKEATHGTTQRTLGYAVGGLGVLSFVGAGLVAYRAHALDQGSLSHCLADEPNACDVEGASQRGQARTYGNVATGLLAAGGVLTVTGFVLLITAPSGSPAAKVQVGTVFLPGGASLVATGSL